MERYTNLYRLSENLYTPGSPVLLAAGALLKDNQTGTVLAQLKFKNISSKEIKAVMVSVDACDVASAPVDGVSEYQYLDLSAGRDSEFGQKQAIALPDANTRHIVPRCNRVIFADGTTWTADEGAGWSALPAPVSLENAFGAELAEQYRRDTVQRAKYVPASNSDLWLCTCGVVNHAEEATCHTCKLTLADMTTAADKEALALKKSARDAAEAEKAAVIRAAAEKRQKKIKQIIVGISTAAVVCVATFLVVTRIVMPVNAYKAAEALLAAGDYDRAIATFEGLGNYKNSVIRILEAQYTKAEALLAAGKYDDAIAVFEELENYGDSATRILEAVRLKLANSEVNDVVNFGNYEQDNNATNGKEKIEWIVLERKDDRILVISRYALDNQPYNKGYSDTYSANKWSTSTIRQWLNVTFLNTAFSKEEQDMIPAMTVSTPNNPTYGTEGGMDTTDQIFLLSIEEAKKYFSSGMERVAEATAYVAANGGNVLSGYKIWWWLRSPGNIYNCTAGVTVIGDIYDEGADVTRDYLAVRPAMWIDLSSIRER